MDKWAVLVVDDQAASLAVRLLGSEEARERLKPIFDQQNGTSRLMPELGYRFQLKLGDKPFAFTVQNGLRTADGHPYGEGTQFSLEVDGLRYDWAAMAGTFAWTHWVTSTVMESQTSCSALVVRIRQTRR
jgi:hypothetical protein